MTKTVSYTDVYKDLGLNPVRPRCIVSGLSEGLLLNPWQVIGTAWAIQQEAGPVHGGIIADACGIGKTVQMLSVIAYRGTKEFRPLK